MRCTITLTVLLVATLTLTSHSQTPKFQTDAATQAITKYLRAVETARRDCLAELAAAARNVNLRAAVHVRKRRHLTVAQLAGPRLDGVGIRDLHLRARVAP